MHRGNLEVGEQLSLKLRHYDVVCAGFLTESSNCGVKLVWRKDHIANQDTEKLRMGPNPALLSNSLPRTTSQVQAFSHFMIAFIFYMVEPPPTITTWGIKPVDKCYNSQNLAVMPIWPPFILMPYGKQEEKVIILIMGE